MKEGDQAFVWIYEGCGSSGREPHKFNHKPWEHKTHHLNKKLSAGLTSRCQEMEELMVLACHLFKASHPPVSFSSTLSSRELGRSVFRELGHFWEDCPKCKWVSDCSGCLLSRSHPPTRKCNTPCQGVYIRL